MRLSYQKGGLLCGDEMQRRDQRAGEKREREGERGGEREGGRLGSAIRTGEEAADATSLLMALLQRALLLTREDRRPGGGRENKHDRIRGSLRDMFICRQMNTRKYRQTSALDELFTTVSAPCPNL